MRNASFSMSLNKLMNALKTRNNTKVSQLVEKMDANALNQKNDIGLSALHMVCRIYYYDALVVLLGKPGLDINDAGAQGRSRTPLHLACRYNNHQALPSLLAYPGVHVNAKTDNDMTPVMFAAAWCHHEALKLMLEDPRVELEAKNEDGNGLGELLGLRKAVPQDKTKCLKMIEEARIRRTHVTNAQKNHEESVQQHIEKILKINEKIRDEEKRCQENMTARNLKAKELYEGHLLEKKTLDDRYTDERTQLIFKHRNEGIVLNETFSREDETNERYMAILKENRKELIEHLDKLNGGPANDASSNDREKLEAVKGVLDCPICLEAMEPPTKIWMCQLSHIICEPCKDRLDGRDCPTCRAQPVTLRAFVMEEVARTAFSD